MADAETTLQDWDVYTLEIEVDRQPECACPNLSTCCTPNCYHMLDGVEKREERKKRQREREEREKRDREKTQI